MFGYQRMFRYQCRDLASDSIVWERWQPKKEDSPQEIHVSDEGECGVLCQDTVFAIDGVGRRAAGITLSSSEPVFGGAGRGADYVDDNIHDTSAGQQWAMCSMAYFLKFDGARLFVVTPHWGRRIVLDLTSGLWRNSSEFENASGAPGVQFRKCEAEIARNMLQRAVGRPDLFTAKAHESESYDDDAPLPIVVCRGSPQDIVFDTITAMLVVQEQRLQNSLDAIRWLERSDVIGGTTSSGAFSEYLSEKSTYTFLIIRCFAQRTLRLLGRVPEELPAYLFGAQPTQVNDNGLSRIRVGSDADTVLRVAGLPSYIRDHPYWIDGKFFRDEFWEYDFGAGETGRTVRLLWSHKTPGKLTSIDDPGIPIWLDPRFKRRLVEL